MLDNFGGRSQNHGGTSWCLGHRSRGDAPMTCLGIIIATIALGVWAYYHFWHNRALERAGQDINISKVSDTAAINAYRFRVRDRLLPATERVNRNTRSVCMKVYKGKAGDKEQMSSDFTKYEEEMRELIGDINEAIVPTKFGDMHRNMAVSVGCNWTALCKAREAMKTDDAAIKKQLIEESKKELSKGNKAYEAAKLSAAGMFR